MSLRIYVDMDGVMADFCSTALQVLGSSLDYGDIRDWNFFEYDNLTEKEFWEMIGQDGADFWANLPAYPHLHPMIALIKAYDPNFQIVTQPGKDTLNSVVGKMQWIDRNLGQIELYRVHFSNPQQGKSAYLRNRGDILIDDNPRHIQAWEAAGGIGYLFPQPWNTPDNSWADSPLPGLRQFLADRLEKSKFSLVGDDAPTLYVDEKTGGRKEQKLCRIDLIPARALQCLGRVFGWGAGKYSEHNFRKGYPWSKSIASLHRHIAAFVAGEDLDPESQLPHLAHAAWHLMALLTFMEEHPDQDDRYKA